MLKQNAKLIYTLLIISFVAWSCSYLSPQLDNEVALQNTPSVSYLSNPNQTIYFTLNSLQDDRVEIWKTGIDGNSQQRIAYFSGKYPISAFPSEEQAVLSWFCSSSPTECNNNDNLGRYGILDIQLSSDKRKIIVVDGASLCFGTDCFGFQRVLLMNLEELSSPPSLLLTIPLHNLKDQRVSQYIEETVWSPDGSKISITVSLHKGGSHFSRIIDVKTMQTINVDGAGKVAWSPSGDWFSYILQDVKTGTEKFVVTKNNENLIIDEKWEKISGAGWSSDSKNIAITATKAGQALLYLLNLETGNAIQITTTLEDVVEFYSPVWSPDQNRIVVIGKNSNNRMQVYTIDMTSGEHVESNVSYDLYKVEWSMDGKILAGNAYLPGPGNLSEKILILESRNLKPLREIKLDSIEDANWLQFVSWGSNGSTMLIHIGNAQPCSENRGIGLYNLEEDRFDMIPLNSYIKGEIENCKAILGKPIW